MKEEFNLSKTRESDFGADFYYWQRNVKEFIKRNIGCGIDIGGMTCGSSDYKCKVHYCKRCQKLIKDAGEKLK